MHKAFNFEYRGVVNTLITPVGIALPSLSQPFDENKPIQHFEVAIWDTGAQGTTINEKIVQSLDLKPHGFGKSKGVDGVVRDVRVFKIDLVLPNQVVVGNLNVREAPASNDFDVLIGMDVIQAGDFAISNIGGKTNFSFAFPPFRSPINFVERANRVNARLVKKNRKRRS